jgi:FMN phosphatase YigB (HAD superfamily)
MAKPILFIDWHGTLSSGLFWLNIQKNDPIVYDQILRVLFDDKMIVRSWMRGEYSSEDICDLLSLSVHLDRNTLFNDLKTSCEHLTLDKNIAAGISRARSGYHVVLATDNMDCFSRFSVPALKLRSVFHDILISSDLKRLKNDDGGAFFTSYLTEAGTDIRHATLIDDNADTCALFRSIGGNALRTDGPNSTIRLLESLSLERDSSPSSQTPRGRNDKIS